MQNYYIFIIQLFECDVNRNGHLLSILKLDKVLNLDKQGRREMYNQKRYVAGATIDTYNIMSTKPKRACKRATKEKPTPEKTKLQNELMAKDKATRKMNANFTADDFHIVLTFAKSKRPSAEQGIKIYEKVLAKLRKEYKDKNIVFKYMAVYGFLPKDGLKENEYQPNFEHNEEVPHFHFVATYIDVRVWTKAWKEYGRAMIFPLDERGDYSQLANYLIEHTKNNFRETLFPMKQRYACSRNLINPKPKKKKVKADIWREQPKPLKGYYIDWDSLRIGVSEVTGYPYQFYRMIKINPRE